MMMGREGDEEEEENDDGEGDEEEEDNDDISLLLVNLCSLLLNKY